jgi:ATP-dependent phosphoenolpyruvate carboxykinase
MKTTKYLNCKTTKLSKCTKWNIESKKHLGNPALYDIKAAELAAKFKANFAKFEEFANAEIMAGAPLLTIN